jgi:hypothetical protein
LPRGALGSFSALGGEFSVFTMALPDERGYADWKRVVDQAVETMRFLGP